MTRQETVTPSHVGGAFFTWKTPLSRGAVQESPGKLLADQPGKHGLGISALGIILTLRDAAAMLELVQA